MSELNSHKSLNLYKSSKILRRLLDRNLKEGESMRVHLDRIFQDLMELAEMDAALENKMALTTILASLPDEYDDFIDSLNDQFDKLTVHALRYMLIEEYRRKQLK